MSVTNEKWRDAAAKIGGRVGAEITGALERSEVLTSLDVRNNKIGPTGATAIAEALKFNRVLNTLSLFGNQISDTSKKALRAVVQGRDGFQLYL